MNENGLMKPLGCDSLKREKLQLLKTKLTFRGDIDGATLNALVT